MPRKALLPLAAVLVALGTQTGFAQTVWRHGMVEAKNDAGFTFMAADGGFAKKNGLDLQIDQFKGDAIAMKALLAGDLDSYEGSPGSPLIAASRGGDIKAVGCWWPGLNYDVIAKKDVASVKDLAGKSFAISSPGALPDLFARAVLENSNVSAADIKFAAMGSDADRFRAVSIGVIDAAAVSSEFTPLLAAAGLRVIARGSDTTPNFLRFCIYMSGKTIAERPKDAAKFLASEIEALRHAVSDRDAVIALTRKVTGDKPDDPRPTFIANEAIDSHLVAPDMPIPVDKLAWMQNLFIATGNQKTPAELSKFVDASVRADALKIADLQSK